MAEAADEKGKSGRWGFFKIGKGVVKKKPGKLPPRPEPAVQGQPRSGRRHPPRNDAPPLGATANLSFLWHST